MSEKITVSAHEHGVVRVFAVDLPEGETLTHDGAEAALGTAPLDPDYTQIVALKDLEGLGLSDFLIEGMGLPEDQINPMRPQLEALTGQVLVLSSPAMGGAARHLTPRAPLRLVGTFHEDSPPVKFEQLPSGGATGAPLTGKTRPSDAAMSGRVALIALLVLFALVAVMVWVAA